MNPTTTKELENGYVLIHHFDEDRLGYVCDITNKKGIKVIEFASHWDDDWNKIRKDAIATAKQEGLDDLIDALKNFKGS